MSRRHRTLIAVIAASAALGAWHATVAAEPELANRSALTGLWQITLPEGHLRPEGGGAIPFTPEGKAEYQRTAQRLAREPALDASISKCVPQGVPRSLIADEPFEIAQTYNQVVFVHAINREFRIVLLQAQHNDPSVWDPSYMGDAIGRWDGATLVIDSSNFNQKTLLDKSGLPHSEQLHMIERWRVLGGGAQLEDIVRIDDPKTFSRPWSARLLFRRRMGQLATDWVCGEPHRALASKDPTLASTKVPPELAAFNGFWREARGARAPVGPALGGPRPGQIILQAAQGHLQPWAEKLWRRYQADFARGIEDRTNAIECLPWAIPGIGIPGGPAYSMDIVATANEVLFLYQLDHQAHIVYLNQMQPKVPRPSYFGHSVGRWEADTLVIDSSGFNDKTEIADGIAHSAALHVTERLRLRDQDRLEDEVTYQDTQAFTASISFVHRFERAAPFQEYVCAENNLDSKTSALH